MTEYQMLDEMAVRIVNDLRHNPRMNSVELMIAELQNAFSMGARETAKELLAQQAEHLTNFKIYLDDSYALAYRRSPKT